MKPRRVARELAVIVLSQLPKKKDKIEALEIESLLATSIESLTDYAKQLLDDSSSRLQDAAQTLDGYEMDHPKNVRQVHSMRPVEVTSEFLREHLEKIDIALALLSEAIVIPELTMAFSKGMQSEVRDFAVELLTTYVNNREAVEKIGKEMKSKWRQDRMMSIDRNILTLAITELFFMPDIPEPVCVNEAVELCHRFADQRAAKFLNGVLGDMVEDAEYFRLTGEFRAPTSASDSEAPSEEPVV